MSKTVTEDEAGALSSEWSFLVEAEVAKINQEDKIKVRKQISAAWKANAAIIKKNKKNYTSGEKVYFFRIKILNLFMYLGSHSRHPSPRNSTRFFSRDQYQQEEEIC